MIDAHHSETKRQAFAQCETCKMWEPKEEWKTAKFTEEDLVSINRIFLDKIMLGIG